MYERNQSNAFQTIFCNFKISKFFVINEKIDNYGANYHRYMVQPLDLHILRRSY